MAEAAKGTPAAAAAGPTAGDAPRTPRADAAAGDGASTGSAASLSATGEAPEPHRVFYALGVGVQTLLWFLLFIAIVVAVAVGGELTEFRYVGF